MTTPVMTYRWAEPESWTLATYERTEGYRGPAHRAGDGA